MDNLLSKCHNGASAALSRNLRYYFIKVQVVSIFNHHVEVMQFTRACILRFDDWLCDIGTESFHLMSDKCL